jgi:hypothetical protein
LAWRLADAPQDQDIVDFGEDAELGCNRRVIEVGIGGREENCRLYHTFEELLALNNALCRM